MVYSITMRDFLLACVLICGTAFIIIFNVKRRPLWKFAATLPGPPTVPVFGNALLFLGNPADLFEALSKVFDSYPSPARVWLGPRLEILVKDADQLKEILLHDKMVEKHDAYYFGSAFSGSGLFVAHEKTWRIRRKIIAPTLNSSMVKSFFHIFCKQAKLITRQLECCVDQPEFDVSIYIARYALRTICETAMNIDISSETQSLDDYQKALESYVLNQVESLSRHNDESFEIMFQRAPCIWLHPDVIFRLTKLGKKNESNLDLLFCFSKYIIETQKKARLDRAKKQPKTFMDYKNTPPKKLTFLELLLELSANGDTLSETDVRNEVDTMLVAGYDTSATMIDFVLLMLASHPQIQETCYQELCNIFGTDDDLDITYGNTHRMEYIERVIKETMRLFPVGPFLGRKALEDVFIDGTLFPKGTTVVLGIISLHRDPKYWSDPLTFNPDRFLREEIAKRHPYCYLPFLIGPRNCPGGRFAMMSMKILVATLLRSYRIIKDDVIPIKNIRLKSGLIIKTVEKIRVGIKLRKQGCQNIATP